MFQAKYELTGKLLIQITQAERFYGQIEALRIPKQLEVNLNRDNLVQSSYASNKIEGNPLTLPEVTNLLLDDRVPTNRDEKEIVNYFKILKRLDKYKNRQINLKLIVQLHKCLMEGVDKTAGEIRNQQVVVGKFKGEKGNVSLRVKHNPPFHKRKQIEKALVELLEWTQRESQLPAVIEAGVFHHQFVYIHPFEDGNGRVCRLLTAILFLKRGYEINKYFVLDDYYDIDRSEYSDKLNSADKGDKTLWLEYFAEGMQYSLKSAFARLESGMRRLRIDRRPSKKESQVLEMLQEQPEITSTEVAARLKVSRQQAHNLLKKLVDKGFAERKGSTKSSYYILK